MHFGSNFRRMLDIRVFLLISVLIFLSGASAAETASICKKPPKFVQIHYDFKWPIVSRANLANALTLQCGEPENIDFLRIKIENYLRLLGLSDVKIQLRSKNYAESIEFFVMSKNDYQKEQTILFELEQKHGPSDLLPLLKLSGEPTEGELIKANFSFDRGFIDTNNLLVTAKWLRNDEPIENANSATYKINEDDINQKIGFVITIEKNGRIIAHRGANFSKKIQYAPRVPSVKNAKIIGSPFVGSELKLEYDFFDFNPDDREGKTIITWSQNGKVIFGENTSSYLVKRGDVGSIISAKIRPVTLTGEKGKTSIVSLSSRVKDPFWEATQSLETAFLKATESAEKFSLSQDNSLVAQDNNNPYRTKILQDVYISDNIKIRKLSPRQMVSIKTDSYFENSYKVVNALENEFFGLDSSEANLNKLARRAGELAAVNNSNSEYLVTLPPQVINNGVIKVNFSKIPLVALEKNKNSVKETEVNSIKELWIWGFVAHYLRLFL